MALPADVSTRQVHGAWIGMDGNPRSGSVTFTPTAEKLVNVGSSTIIIGTVITAHLDAGGEATATLPCTDDEDLGGGPFSYLVTVSLTGDEPYAFWIDLPEDPSVLELAAVTPILPASGGSTVVTSVNGLTGAVTLSPADIGAEVAGTAVGVVAGHVLAADPHGDRAYAVQRANHTGTQPHTTITGLGGAATLNVGTAAGTVAAGDDTRITGAAQKSANLSDLASAATARDNLGLGDSAVLDVGTTAGTVCAGDDPRLEGGGGGGVPTSRLITAGTGLAGGGDLTADRTLSANFGTAAGTIAQGNDTRITGAAQKASNLSDLASAATARTNLGLGTAAVAAIGTATGNVAAANPARCSLLRNTDLTLTSGTVYAVPMTGAAFQVGGTWWTTGSAITVPAGATGLYVFYVRAVFKAAGANTGERAVWLRRLVGGPLVDDPPVTSQPGVGPGGTSWPDPSAAGLAVLTAGETYYVSVRQSLGADVVLGAAEVIIARFPGT